MLVGGQRGWPPRDGRPDLRGRVGRPARRGWPHWNLDSTRLHDAVATTDTWRWFGRRSGLLSAADDRAGGEAAATMSRDDEDPFAREPVRDFALPPPRQSPAVPKSKVSGILIRVTVGRSLKAATMPVAGAILVSLLVSVVIVRRRSRASASPEIHAQNGSANCPERASAELESGLGASPRGFESRILRANPKSALTCGNVVRIRRARNGVASCRAGADDGTWVRIITFRSSVGWVPGG